MDKKERKEQLRVAATRLISDNRFWGEAYYLRNRLIEYYDMRLSPDCLRSWMKELCDEGHFVRSKYPHGGQGYTYSLPSPSTPKPTNIE